MFQIKGLYHLSKMTTPINCLHSSEDSGDETDDFAMADVCDQIAFLREYLKDFPIKALDLFSHFDRKYRASGTTHLSKFLESVCSSEGFEGNIKLIAAESLLSFHEELEPVEEPHIEIKRLSNRQAAERNCVRMSRGVACLSHVLKEIISFTNVASVLKFDSILRLYELSEYGDDLPVLCEELLKTLLSNKSLEPQYRLRLTTRIPDQKLAWPCFLHFLGDPGNPTSMRILAAQALLSSDEETQEHDAKDIILAQIEIFARDEGLDGFVRADAADVMLGFGDETTQSEARLIIAQIGRKTGFGLYENTQNVHAESVDESMRSSLDTLSAWTKDNSDKLLDFESTLDKIRIRRNDLEQTKEIIRDAETAFLRIKLGKRKYQGFTSEKLLCSVCAWIWNQDGEIQNELWKRFDQELSDMTNTCTTGIVSRLINILSGWGGFQIKISFKDQIRSNFSGRLNAIARKLMEGALSGEHEFYRERKNAIASIYISDELEQIDKKPEINQKELLAAMMDRGLEESQSQNDETAQPAITPKYLSREEKISEIESKHPTLHKDAREHFSDRLFLEFSSTEPNRKCFHVFFNFSFSKVTEELRSEFSSYVSPDDFEICVRDALAFYEGN